MSNRRTLVPVHLTKVQSKRLINGANKREPVKIELSSKNIQEGGEYPLMLNARQMKAVEKSQATGKGCRLTVSPSQMKECLAVSEQMGTGFFTDLAKTVAKAAIPAVVGSISEKALPGSGKTAKKVTKGIASSLGLGCMVCSQCMGSGLMPGGTPMGVSLSGNGAPSGRGLGEAATKDQLAML